MRAQRSVLASRVWLVVSLCVLNAHSTQASTSTSAANNDDPLVELFAMTPSSQLVRHYSKQWSAIGSGVQDFTLSSSPSGYINGYALQNGNILRLQQTAAQSSWVMESKCADVTGSFVKITASPTAVWALTSTGQLLIRSPSSSCTGSPSQMAWRSVPLPSTSTSTPSALSYIAACPSSHLLAIDQASGLLYVRRGITPAAPAGSTWAKISSPPLSKVSCGSGIGTGAINTIGLWGLDAMSGQVLFRHGAAEELLAEGTVERLRRWESAGLIAQDISASHSLPSLVAALLSDSQVMVRLPTFSNPLLAAPQASGSTLPPPPEQSFGSIWLPLSTTLNGSSIAHITAASWLAQPTTTATSTTTSSTTSSPMSNNVIESELSLEPGWTTTTATASSSGGNSDNEHGVAWVSALGLSADCCCVLSGRVLSTTSAPWAPFVSRQLPFQCRPDGNEKLIVKAGNWDSISVLEVAPPSPSASSTTLSNNHAILSVTGGQQEHGWMSLDGIWFVAHVPYATIQQNASTSSSSFLLTLSSNGTANASSVLSSFNTTSTQPLATGASASQQPVTRVDVQVPAYWANPLPGYRPATAVLIRDKTATAVCALTGMVGSSTSAYPTASSVSPPAQLIRIASRECVPSISGGSSRTFLVATSLGARTVAVKSNGDVALVVDDSALTLVRDLPTWISLEGVVFASGRAMHLVALALGWDMYSQVSISTVGDWCVLSGAVSPSMQSLAWAHIATVPSYCKPISKVTLTAHIRNGSAPIICTLALDVSGRLEFLGPANVPQKAAASHSGTNSVVLSLDGLIWDVRAPTASRVLSDTGVAHRNDGEDSRLRLGSVQSVLDVQGGWSVENIPTMQGPVVHVTESGICILSGIISGTLGICDKPLAALPPRCVPASPFHFQFPGLTSSLGADSGMTSISLQVSSSGALMCDLSTQPLVNKDTNTNEHNKFWLSLSNILFTPNPLSSTVISFTPHEKLPDYILDVSSSGNSNDDNDSDNGPFSVLASGAPTKSPYRAASVTKVGTLCLLSGQVVVSVTVKPNIPPVAQIGVGCRPYMSQLFVVSAVWLPSRLGSVATSAPTDASTTDSELLHVALEIRPTGDVVMWTSPHMYSTGGSHSNSLLLTLDSIAFAPVLTSASALSLSPSFSSLVSSPTINAIPSISSLYPHAPAGLDFEAGICVMAGSIVPAAFSSAAATTSTAAISGLSSIMLHNKIATVSSGCRPNGTLAMLVPVLDLVKLATKKIDSPVAFAQVNILASGDVILVDCPFQQPLLSLSGIHYDPFVSSDVLDQISRARQLVGSGGESSTRVVGQTSVEFEVNADGHLAGMISKTIGSLSGSFTVDTWFMATASNEPDVQNVLNVIAEYPGAFGLRLGSRSNGTFWIEFGNGVTYTTSSTQIVYDKWYHVALVKNSSAISLVLDDSIVATFSRDASLGCGVAVCGGSLALPMAIAQGFNGRLAEFRIWKVALTFDVLQTKSQTRLNSWEPNLLINYQFATPQSIAYDHSGNNPLASVTGTITWIREGPPGLRDVRPNGQVYRPTCALTANGRIKIPTTPLITFSKTEAFALEFWFNAARHSASGSWLAIKNGAFGVQWMGKSSPLQYFDGTVHTGSQATFLERSWYHVAVVDTGVEQGTIALYIDGVLDASDSRGGAYRTGAQASFSIGGIAPRYFQGSIADVRIWRGIRTPQNIRSQMTYQLTGHEQGLMAYFKFQTEMSMATDSSQLGGSLLDANGNGDDSSEGSVVGDVVWQMQGPNLSPAPDSVGTGAGAIDGSVMRYRGSGVPVATTTSNSSVASSSSNSVSSNNQNTQSDPDSNSNDYSSMCPKKCSGNGVCEPRAFSNTSATFVCRCARGFTGVDCSSGCPMWCNDRGTCIDGKCFCKPGFRGSDCSIHKESSQISPHPQCSFLDPSLPLFCSTVTHAVPRAIAHDASRIDQSAMATFQKLSRYCNNSPIGRQLMKQAICSSYFLGCDTNGNPVGVCQSVCREYSSRCNLDVGICARDGMYVDDGNVLSIATASRTSATGITDFNSSLVAVADGRFCEAIGVPTSEQCPRNCSNNGACVKGLCACNTGYGGPDCSQYDGDHCTTTSRDRSFCSIVDYAFPAAIDVLGADTTAKQAYGLLESFCGRENPKALLALKYTMCATSFVKCDASGRILKPCRSMCEAYASLCGISSGLSCFGSFYEDEPNCFSLPVPYSQLVLDALRDSPFGVTDHMAPELRELFTCPNNYTCVHGMCESGTCACMAGWMSHDCSVAMPTCSRYCSGHGVCQDQKCKCLPGWQGESCSESTSLCDFECLEDGWRVESCCATLETLLHSPTRLNNYVDELCSCSGHGSCISLASQSSATNSSRTQQHTQRCVCDVGWQGAKCDIPVPCEGGCSGHGTCVVPAPRPGRTFFVNDTSTTADAEQQQNESAQVKQEVVQLLNETYIAKPYFSNDQESSVNSNNNSNNQTQEGSKRQRQVTLPSVPVPPYCECDSNFRGSDCSIPIVPPHLCPHSCSLHGHCAVAGRFSIPNNSNNGTKNFNGSMVNGKWVSAHNNSNNSNNSVNVVVKYRCVCDKGYSGEDCHVTSVCLHNCSGHGLCMDGHCACNPFRQGPDCSVILPQCGVHFKCLNLGTCDDSGLKCNCLHTLFTGTDCSQKIQKPKCPTDFNCTNGGICDVDYYSGKIHGGGASFLNLLESSDNDEHKSGTGVCLCPKGMYGYDCGGNEWSGLEPHPNTAQQPSDKLFSEVAEINRQFDQKHHTQPNANDAIISGDDNVTTKNVRRPKAVDENNRERRKRPVPQVGVMGLE